MKIQEVNIEDIIPYAKNPRQNDEAIAKVASSLKEFGWRQPIVVDKEMVVIAGHTRLGAARRLNYKKVPIHIATDLTENQIKAYRIADNRVGQEAKWDEDLLSLELKDLQLDGYDLEQTGFNDDELDALLAEAVTEGLVDEDQVPPEPEEATSVLGDVWLLGNHRVICGDATDINIWEDLKIENGIVCFTSPPYNLGNSIQLSGNKYLNKKKSPYGKYQDNVDDDDYINLIKSSLNCALSFCDVSVFNLQPLSKSKRPLMNLLSEYSSKMIDIITWDKGHAAPQIKQGIMSSRYEWLFLYSNKDNASRVIPYASWQGKFSNVYQAPPQRNNEFAKIHGATFPVHLPEFVIGDLMNKSRGLVDCFCGTGTSIIAAEKLGRIGYGIEIDPKYVDVIVQRWQDFTGKKAIHEKTNKTFDEMKNGSNNIST